MRTAQESTPEQKLFQISQKALFYDSAEKKFLFLKPANKEGNFYKNYGPWDIPGGRIDADEDASEALEREIVEEIGKEVRYAFDQSFQPLGRMEMRYTSATVMNVASLAFYQGGEITLSQEHSESRWATAEEVEKEEDFKPWLKQYVRAAVERLTWQGYLEDWKRTQAEFENYKKRQAAQQKELGGYLIEKLVLDIIPVLDNFRSATLHVPAEQKESPWVIGIQYIEKQLESVLTDNGMETIEVKEGEEFDPKLHESISIEENNEGEGAKHIVAKVLQKGYKFGDRVIRPAKVTIT